MGEYRLIIRALEGAEEKTIATGPLNEVQFDVAWSPDGKSIAMPLSQPQGALGGMTVFDAETGKRTDFLISKDWFISRPVWLPDGSGLLALGSALFSNQQQIFHIAYPSGKISPVTRDTSSYTDLSLAADGHTVATVQGQRHMTPYVMADGASVAQAKALHAGRLAQLLDWLDPR